MRKRLLIAFLSTAIAVPMALHAEPSAPSAPAKPAAKPVYGTYGFDTAGMNKGVKPGDNFYLYADEAWLKANPVPADKSNYGMFTVLDDLSKERTKTILDAAKGEQFVSEVPYPGFIPGLVERLKPEVARDLPIHPDNVAVQFRFDPEWWAAQRAPLTERWNAWLLQ